MNSTIERLLNLHMEFKEDDKIRLELEKELFRLDKLELLPDYQTHAYVRSILGQDNLFYTVERVEEYPFFKLNCKTELDFINPDLSMREMTSNLIQARELSELLKSYGIYESEFQQNGMTFCIELFKFKKKGMNSKTTVTIPSKSIKGWVTPFPHNVVLGNPPSSSYLKNLGVDNSTLETSINVRFKLLVCSVNSRYNHVRVFYSVVLENKEGSAKIVSDLFYDIYPFSCSQFEKSVENLRSYLMSQILEYKNDLKRNTVHFTPGGLSYRITTSGTATTSINYENIFGIYPE